MRPTRRAVLLAPAALTLGRAAAQQPATDTHAELLAEEHAAIHLYGLLAPRLPESLRDAARAAYDDHRRHRDELAEAIRRAGGTPPPPRLTYALPAPLTDPVVMATRIEDALSVRWRAALAGVPARERAAFATALGDEAVHLATLRWATGRSAKAAAPAFPGR